SRVERDHIVLSRIGGSSDSMQVPFRGFDDSINKVTLGIRPEHVRLVPNREEGMSASVCFAEELGDVTYIHGKLADGTPIAIRSDGARYDGEAICQIRLEPTGIRLFDA